MSEPEHADRDEFTDEEIEELDRRADEVADGKNVISLDEWIENADE